jgi:CBS domain-containing protein
LRDAERAKADDLLVKRSPSGWSLVTKDQLRALAADGKGATALGSLLPMLHVPFLHPDHPLETALRYVDRYPMLPVISRADFRQLEGVITERDVLERYREFGEG